MLTVHELASILRMVGPHSIRMYIVFLILVVVHDYTMATMKVPISDPRPLSLPRTVAFRVGGSVRTV